MSWNNGYERKKFEQKQRTQAKEYSNCGMSESQIQEMYLHDLREYRNNRNYAIHIQSIDELENYGDKIRGLPHKKHLVSVSCSIDISECGRFDWIEEIENAALYGAIFKLTPDQKELLTLLYRDGYSQTEAAVILKSNLLAINKRVSRIHNRIRKLIAENGGLGNV